MTDVRDCIEVIASGGVREGAHVQKIFEPRIALSLIACRRRLTRTAWAAPKTSLSDNRRGLIGVDVARRRGILLLR